MIVTDTLKARGGLDFLWADDSGAEGFMRDKLRGIIVREGENIGAFIRPESIYYTKREDGTRHQFIITAYWCPDPREGCEFRGGPNDGKVMGVGSEHTRPPDVWRVPPEVAPPQLVSRDEAELVPVYSMSIAHYELWGIDSALDRWVYRFQS